MTKAEFDSTTGVGDPHAPVKLLGFNKMWSLTTGPSPYVCKVATYLRFAGIPYTQESAWPANQPKGKLPCIHHGDNVVPDSSLIIAYLERTYGDRLYQAPSAMRQLSPEQQALGMLAERAISGPVTQIISMFKWLLQDEESFTSFASDFFKGDVAKGQQMRKRKEGQHDVTGLRAFTREELLFLVKADLEAVSTLLGSKPYLLGEAPSTVDAALFGILDNCYYFPYNPPDLKALLDSLPPNLKGHTARIRERFYQDRLQELAKA